MTVPVTGGSCHGPSHGGTMPGSSFNPRRLAQPAPPASAEPGSTSGSAGPHVQLLSPWATDDGVATAAAETVFVGRLRELARMTRQLPAPVAALRRQDATTILTALRGGLGADEMMRIAPGLRADVLVATYDDLEDRRARSEL